MNFDLLTRAARAVLKGQLPLAVKLIGASVGIGKVASEGSISFTYILNSPPLPCLSPAVPFIGPNVTWFGDVQMEEGTSTQCPTGFVDPPPMHDSVNIVHVADFSDMSKTFESPEGQAAVLNVIRDNRHSFTTA